ncbi:hypothetical protein N6H14_26885 [Paenibacillus sp. CC-CFT747]|nr:hypothetical protein N6H14_26885 [Paenibacillus sp. CC-CFT747]
MKRSKPDWYDHLAKGPFAGATFTQRHVDGTLKRVTQAKLNRRPNKRWAAWGRRCVFLPSELGWCGAGAIGCR